MTSVVPARILIVDDEDLVRDLLRAMVTSLGYEVVAAVPRARAALNILATDEQIDLLLTDVVMPGGIDGRQLAESVRRDHPGLAILLVSGHEGDLSTHDIAQSAHTAFLRKPFRKRDLAENLSALLDR